MTPRPRVVGNSRQRVSSPVRLSRIAEKSGTTERRGSENHPSLTEVPAANGAESSSAITPSVPTIDGPIYLPNAPGSAASFLPSKGPDGLLDSASGSDWELTWPIWHMLPHDERKNLAIRHGFKSIGEFEEYVTLTRAVGASEAPGEPVERVGDGSYSNEKLYEVESDPRNWGGVPVAATVPKHVHLKDGDRKAPAKVSDCYDDNGEDEDRSSSISGDDADARASEGEDEVDVDAKHKLALEVGGLPCLLPDDVHLRIFSFLDVHAYVTASLVSPHWSSFTRTETVYKQICRRCYLNQSHRKALHPQRFGGSYRTMLEQRPRVRTGGGLYVMRYAHVKKIERDMWTEVPHGVVLETVYYRYMYFHESGRVLYALTSRSPVEVLGRFALILAGCDDSMKKISGLAWGRYEVRMRDVTVWASHPWHDVRMELRIMDADESRSNHFVGKNCGMTFVRHQSSARGDFDEWTSRDLVEYDVPDNCFRFLPDGRL